MSRPLRIAMTGGIASGKSTAADFFAALGVPVIDSDALAREVVAPGTPGFAAVVTRFGPAILRADGTLDRQRLRSLIFANPAARADLEAITHPLIRALATERARAAGGVYQIHIIPLLVEGGLKAQYDRVLVIDCPEPVQLERLLQRDGADEITARAMLAAQATRAERLAIADDVIVNRGDREALRERVAALHATYLDLAVVAGKDRGPQ
ncbi:MAG: dephospho-CoA kinase [Steroidobacteraceae bacterium]